VNLLIRLMSRQKINKSSLRISNFHRHPITMPLSRPAPQSHITSNRNRLIPFIYYHHHFHSFNFQSSSLALPHAFIRLYLLLTSLSSSARNTVKSESETLFYYISFIAALYLQDRCSCRWFFVRTELNSQKFLISSHHRASALFSFYFISFFFGWLDIYVVAVVI
jgi:hypothetical protein